MSNKPGWPFRRACGTLIVLSLLCGSVFIQARAKDWSETLPGIEGVYEMMLPESGPVRLQIYHVGNRLRTLENGKSESWKWDPVEGQELQFSRTSPKQGVFLASFIKDEKGRYRQFRLTNAAMKLDVMAVWKGELNDANPDPASPSDRLSYLERHYIKAEYRIPMRDGVKLFTQVYSPLDAAELHPIILLRTPYGNPPYGENFRDYIVPSLHFARENYILVCQDIRGTAMSEGKLVFATPYKKDKKNTADIDESSDAYDTVEWLLKNVTNHNGKVGVIGSSYPGFSAAMAAIAAHPAIKAVSPQAVMADLFQGDDGHHNGAFYLAHIVPGLYAFGQTVHPLPTTEPLPRLRIPIADGYSFYLGLGPLKNITAHIFGNANELWNEAMAHETYDAYWQSRSILPHLRGIGPAVLTVGGWYDAEDLQGTLRTYQTIERQNPGGRSTLVMGPWVHGGWKLSESGEDRGVFTFSGTKAYFQEQIELPFFNHYLKEQGPQDIPEAVVFETGTDRWRTFGTWPPAEARETKLFFAANGRISSDPPLESGESGFDEYISDPAKPVPYTAQTTVSCYRDYFVEDQRFAASRPDVLVYVGDVLSEDMSISGPVQAELFVSTSGTDADWVVKVIDVYPDDAPDPKNNPRGIRMGGYQRLVRGDIMRGKFRHRLEKPEPFLPGRVTEVSFALPDIQHAFRKGHRIMVQIQSSWFPLFDRNPQKFCNIRTAVERDFRKATQRLYHSRKYPSGIRFRVIGNGP